MILKFMNFHAFPFLPEALQAGALFSKSRQIYLHCQLWLQIVIDKPMVNHLSIPRVRCDVPFTSTIVFVKLWHDSFFHIVISIRKLQCFQLRLMGIWFSVSLKKHISILRAFYDQWDSNSQTTIPCSTVCWLAPFAIVLVHKHRQINRFPQCKLQNIIVNHLEDPLSIPRVHCNGQLTLLC